MLILKSICIVVLTLVQCKGLPEIIYSMRYIMHRSIYWLTFCILETPKCVLWLTVKTKMKGGI